MSIINLAAYRFVSLSADTLPSLQLKLKTHTSLLGLKGTILLSPEGINLSVAGNQTAITQFKNYLQQCLPILDQLHYHESYSDTQSFQRMLVKLKKQIIPFPDCEVPLKKATAPYLEPNVLKTWLQADQDIVMLDTRNHYEVAAGSFQNAIQLDLKHFRDWPTAIQKLSPALKENPIVTFCTGGIRCEKAAASLMQAGFKTVYQLKGGILNYFKHCGNAYYQGGCFVFDERETLYAEQ